MSSNSSPCRRSFLRTVGASTALLSSAIPTTARLASAESAGTVVFVYDDSSTEDYTKTFPVHQKMGAPACIAVNPAYLGNERFLTEAQLREIATAGWEVISHTSRHRPVGAYPLVRDAHAGDKRVYPLTNNHGKIPGDRIRIFDEDHSELATVAGYGRDDTKTTKDEYIVLETPLESAFKAERAQVSFTEEIVRSALTDSKAHLEAMGYTVTNFVYPHGNKSERVREMVPTYYQAVANGRWVDGLNKIDGLDPYRLHRAYFRPGKMTEADLETYFERLTEEDVFGILAGHSAYEDFTAERVRLAIEMAQTHNVEIRTLREMMVDLDVVEPPSTTTIVDGQLNGYSFKRI